jgi:hypothetical protein
MLLIAAFWVLLSLPGYALLRRFRAPVLAYGVPSTLTLSYLASFVLLTPLSVAAYLLRLPLSVFSAGIVLAIALAAAWLLIRDRRRWRWSRPSWLAVMLGALILIDALMGLRAGAYPWGDATYHMARVRSLLSYGFNQWDPLVPGQRFDAIYHTNLHHGLLAASAHLAGRHAPEAWLYSWFWAKLFTAGAVYFLAFVMLGRRWLAWIAAGMFTVWMAAYSVVPYPNTLAACGIFPLAMGFGVQAFRRPDRRWCVLGLCAVALVAPQIHGLYYALSCVMVAPPLLARLLYQQLRGRPGPGYRLCALLGLGLGAPWLAVSAAQSGLVSSQEQVQSAPDSTAAAPEPATNAEAAEKSLDGLDRGFVRLPSGLIRLELDGLSAPSGQAFQLLLAIAAGLCSARRRRQFVALAGFTAVVLACLYVPWICSPLAELLGAPWIVKRFAAVLAIAHHGVFPGAFVLLVSRRFRTPALIVLTLIVALAQAYVSGVDDGDWSRRQYIRRAKGHGRREWLEAHSERRALLQKFVPRGSVVLVPGEFRSDLAVDCDCYPLALPHLNRGQGDMSQRRIDSHALLETELDRPARVALLRHYGVRHIAFRNTDERLARRYKRLYRRLIVANNSSRDTTVFELDLDRP